MTSDAVDVGFRQLGERDLPLLHGWLQEPGIVRWWEGDDVSWDAVVRDYGPGGDAHVEHWLAVVGFTNLADLDDEGGPWRLMVRTGRGDRRLGVASGHPAAGVGTSARSGELAAHRRADSELREGFDVLRGHRLLRALTRLDDDR